MSWTCRSVFNGCLFHHRHLPQSWNLHHCKSAVWPERGNWPKPSCPDETDTLASWIWAETACGNTTNKSFLLPNKRYLKTLRTNKQVSVLDLRMKRKSFGSRPHGMMEHIFRRLNPPRASRTHLNTRTNSKSVRLWPRQTEEPGNVLAKFPQTFFQER